MLTGRAQGIAGLPRREPPVVVVGGANLDVKARSTATAIPRTSNPGHTSTMPGGVARNIAENLARLGTPTRLIAAIGRDAHGERLLAETREAGVMLDHVHRSIHPTGSYTAVLDSDGELVLAVADMTATDELRPEDLRAAREPIGRAALLVVDGNLPVPVTAHLLELADAAGVRVVIDPVSVPKAARLVPLLGPRRPVFAITPNRDELKALTGRETAGDDALPGAAAALHDLGVRHVWIRLGAQGSLFGTRVPGHCDTLEPLPAHEARVEDVTGAGDSMLAAFAHALLAGHSPAIAARYGHAAARLTVESAYTVRPDLTSELLEEAMAESRIHIRRTAK